jgi:hypothetical protein
MNIRCAPVNRNVKRFGVNTDHVRFWAIKDAQPKDGAEKIEILELWLVNETAPVVFVRTNPENRLLFNLYDSGDCDAL